MEPNCGRCIHRTVCKVQERISQLTNSMPYLAGDEMWDFLEKVKKFVADECPEWKEGV